METEKLAKIQILLEEMPTIIEEHKVYAKYIKGRYDNYINVGFNEQQALALIMSSDEDN